jgi:hypothetical protein
MGMGLADVDGKYDHDTPGAADITMWEDVERSDGTWERIYVAVDITFGGIP